MLLIENHYFTKRKLMFKIRISGGGGVERCGPWVSCSVSYICTSYGSLVAERPFCSVLLYFVFLVNCWWGRHVTIVHVYSFYSSIACLLVIAFLWLKNLFCSILICESSQLFCKQQQNDVLFYSFVNTFIMSYLCIFWMSLFYLYIANSC